MSGSAGSWDEVRRLLEQALEQPTGEREAFVRARCGERHDLAAQVLALARHESELGSYLEPPAALLGAVRELQAADSDPSGQRVGAWQLERSIGVGGMGAVYLARRVAGDFEQRGAVKFIRRGMDSAQMQKRFARERQLLAQLEHANVARLFDGGMAEDGTPYLVMEYIEGLAIDAWCDARTLSIEARLRLFAKVCAAVHHAHQRLVVHRDLKPSNILVNAEGEPKLLDFGLAKLLRDEDDAQLTQSGAPAMTPAYASPEQVRGENVTTASDVYSLGIVLYQLLTGRLPYAITSTYLVEIGRTICETEARRPSVVVSEAPEAGCAEPAAAATARALSVKGLQRRLRGDLDTIVLKALRKEPQRRYQSAEQFAGDIERHLAGWPVLAQPDSLGYRSTKFVQRHRTLVGVGAIALLSLAGGLFVSSRLWLLAERRYDELLRLSDVQLLSVLGADADRIWPPVPPASEKMRLWIGHAQELIARKPLHEARLASLRAQARQESGRWVFATTEQAWQHEILDKLVAGIAALADETPRIGTLAEMLARAQFAEQVESRTRTGREAMAAWDLARADIAALPIYRGLALDAQLGLVPLGRNEVTGLWEFWHLQSGAQPQVDPRGGFRVASDSGLVFVLLPGGSFEMGSPPDERGHSPDEGPRHTLTLDPFFVSKFELTQGQWLCVCGNNPSVISPAPADAQAPKGTLAHPLENASWLAVRQYLDRTALDFPSEAQWEYAARAGTQSPWWSGAERESLRGAANLADAAAARLRQDWPEINDWPDLDDGFGVHAPVGSYRPNAFGLFDVLGNVCEWCDDVFGDYDTPGRAGDGRREVGFGRDRPIRGGGFSNAARDLRCAKRVFLNPDFSASQIGVRPVRAIR